MIRLIVPILVLEQHEHHSARRPRPLTGDDQPADHAPGCRAAAARASQLSTAASGSRARSSASGWADGQPGGPVVGQHRLPAGQRLQRRSRRQIQRQRQLHPAGHGLPGRRDPELPEHRAGRGRGPGSLLTTAHSGRERVACPRPRQQLERRRPGPRPGGEVGETAKRPSRLTRRDQRLHLSCRDPADVAEADPHATCRRPTSAFDTRLLVDVGRQHLDPPPLGLVHERIGRVEAHRLLVQQRAQELRPVVDPQPGRLVGEQPEGGAVRLGEAEARESPDHREHALGQSPRRPRAAAGLPRRTAGGGPRSPRPSACGSSPAAAPPPRRARSRRTRSRPPAPGPGR